MTLRCTIEIVPYGDEQYKRELFKLDISNIEQIRDEGFGNQICKYKVDAYEKALPLAEDTWDHVHTVYIEEHNRRDGAVALVQKACDLIKENM